MLSQVGHNNEVPFDNLFYPAKYGISLLNGGSFCYKRDMLSYNVICHCYKRDLLLLPRDFIEYMLGQVVN